MRVTARAPGKLFLLGEYAVLGGGPAVVAAIDRFARVTIAASMGDRIRIRAEDLKAELDVCASALPEPAGPLRFVIAALGRARERFAVACDRALEIEVRGEMVSAEGALLGLGSSAAVTAATVTAVAAFAGRDISEPGVRAVIHDIAHHAHRAAQGGRGSGADVAAAVYGGVVLVTPSNRGVPDVRPLALPRDTFLCVGWTGEKARTVDFVDRYVAPSNGRRVFRELYVETSLRCVEEFLAGLERGEIHLEAIDEQGDALVQLGADLGIPLMTPGLVRLISIARREGAAAKLSGAGGGDCGIALTSDEGTASRIRELWRQAGIMPLEARVACEGVTLVAA